MAAAGTVNIGSDATQTNDTPTLYAYDPLPPTESPTHYVGPSTTDIAPASVTKPTSNDSPTATAAQITKTPQWNNTADQTTQGQLTGIIAANNPVLQQARTGALQQMNDRGLMNSSMATTAGDSAVYAAAVPIAQSDAAQASKVAQTNNANAQQTSIANLNAQNTLVGQNLAAASQQNIADIEAQYKQLTQGSASATSILNNAQQAINNITLNTSLNADAKNAAIAAIRSNLKDSLSMIGGLAGDLDLGKYVGQVTQ